MEGNKTNVRLLSQMALLTGLMIVLGFTPIGIIPVGAINATTMHIPVIIGACFLGPKMGGVLGGIFGIMSVIRATITPNITSFAFTPFYSFSPEFSGSYKSLIVAILPRILIGIVAGYLYKAMMKAFRNKQNISLLFAGVVGSLTNTIGVMGLIYLLFGAQYASAVGSSIELLLGVILAVVTTNGIIEAIVAAVLVLVIGKALSAVSFFRKPVENNQK